MAKDQHSGAGFGPAVSPGKGKGFVSITLCHSCVISSVWQELKYTVFRAGPCFTRGTTSEWIRAATAPCPVTATEFLAVGLRRSCSTTVAYQSTRSQGHGAA